MASLTHLMSGMSLTSVTPQSNSEGSKMFSLFLKLLVNLPTVFSTIHNVIMLVQALNPGAAGPQKLADAVSKVEALVPAVTAVVTSPELAKVISGVVDIAKVTPGSDLYVLKKTQEDPAFIP